jgi:hypothetical protein
LPLALGIGMAARFVYSARTTRRRNLTDSRSVFTGTGLTFYTMFKFHHAASNYTNGGELLYLHLCRNSYQVSGENSPAECKPDRGDRTAIFVCGEGQRKSGDKNRHSQEILGM